MEKEKIEETLRLLESLPSGRKIFFNTGIVMVEITKEEAIKKLKDMLEKIKSEDKN